MCIYCKDKETIFTVEEIVDGAAWSWGWLPDEAITIEEAVKRSYNLILFIDRGYLRLADPDDCQCIDHGKRIKINYCPFCGRRII